MAGGLNRDPVAIVGIGCRYPGGVRDARSFWAALTGRLDAIGPIPRDRIDVAALHPGDEDGRANAISVALGGFVDDIDRIDADFFGLSPREAERLDPQQRLLLETAWEVIEDAGIDAATLEGSATGVFVGQWLSDFEARLFADPRRSDFMMTTGSGRYAASGRLSYMLGLHGPSLTIDTACSSSLVAVQHAAASIRRGECDLALAGGANVILQPHISIAYSASGMLARDGRCKFGSAAADGYVRSEGAGLLVLKPLARALADGNRIYATILGGAVNNDGRTGGSMGTPGRGGQEHLLRAACTDAGMEGQAVTYVEAHGTGTQAGDPVELGALGAVLGHSPGREAPLLVGSVKTNFGHTEGAAGVAGLIKAALALHHRQVPPSLHGSAPNPKIDWQAINCALVQEPVDLDDTAVIGVSAFGIAGTNAHVLLQAAPRRPAADSPASDAGISILALSARSDAALRELASAYAALLAAPGSPPLAAVCKAAATRRTALRERAAFVAGDAATMITRLEQFAAGGSADAEGAASAPPRIGFVAPGQGGQWPGMARALLAGEPAFCNAIAECDRAIADIVDWTIAGQIVAKPGGPDDRMDRIDVIQPVLLALAIAYDRLLRAKGIEPAAVVGHSMGEIAAAAIADVLPVPTAMRLICRRSALMRQSSGQGAMALVELPFAEAGRRIAGREDVLAVGASNSPRASVLSGEAAPLLELLDELQAQGVFTRRISVDVASHSPQMDEAARVLGAEFADLAPQPASLDLYSTVLGERAGEVPMDGAYWARNLRQPVRFAEAIAAMAGSGIDAYIELGPHPVLTTSIEQTLPTAIARSCGRRDVDDRDAFLTLLGTLWCHGASLDWDAVLPGADRHVDLPAYPWQRERYWLPEAELRPIGAAAAPAAGIDEDQREWLHRLSWMPIGASGPPVIEGSWLVIGDACAQPIADAAVALGADCRLVAPAQASADLLAGAAIAIIVAPTDSYRPVELAQVLASPPGAPRLWFVTVASQSVNGEAVDPDAAAVWGAARVIGEERPELWGGLIDVDAIAAAAPQIAAHIAAPDGEPLVAVRSSSRFAVRIERCPQVTATPVTWRSDASYLITGGLGALGLRIADAMIEAGARRLILMSRSSLPPRERWGDADLPDATRRRIAALRRLEARGASVHLAAVDVGDEAAFEAWLDRFGAEQWPAIRGVIHAAGTLANRLAGDMDRATFDEVLRPKLRGALTLDRLLPELDVFVLFSSLAAILPQPGMTNYAAANAGLEAVAANRRARGGHALAVAWGIWANTGMSGDDAGAANAVELERQGHGPLAPDRAQAMIGWLAGLPDTSIAVLKIDWNVHAAHRGSRDRNFLKCVATSAGDQPIGLADLDPAARMQHVEAAIRNALGQVLKLGPARIDARRSFGSMGLTSLLAMELRNRLEVALARPLSATIAWNYPSLEALTAHLAGAAPAEPTLVPDDPAPVDEAIADRLGALAEISEEDALVALMSPRAGSRRR